MGKYLKLFDNYTLYRLFMGGNMILPNVSYCLDENEVYMSKENRLIAVYNTTDVSNTSLYYSNFVNDIQRIWIDDIEYLDIPNTYNFENPGRHVVKILLKDNVTSIKNDAFSGCSKLTSIVIPEGVTSIGERTFMTCSKLVEVIIPESLTSIGNWAFGYCSGLTSMVIPENVTSIGLRAFYNCGKLTSVVVSEGVTSIEEGLFYGCGSLTNVQLPTRVTVIGGEAFGYCSSLTHLVIPKSVTLIGQLAFLWCSSLTSITCLATNPPALGNNAFNNMPGSIYVPASSVEAYKAADGYGWGNYVSKIQAILE